MILSTVTGNNRSNDLREGAIAIGQKGNKIAGVVAQKIGLAVAVKVPAPGMIRIPVTGNNRSNGLREGAIASGIINLHSHLLACGTTHILLRPIDIRIGLRLVGGGVALHGSGDSNWWCIECRLDVSQSWCRA